MGYEVWVQGADVDVRSDDTPASCDASLVYPHSPVRLPVQLHLEPCTEGNVVNSFAVQYSDSRGQLSC